jgi:hypothetical protein
MLNPRIITSKLQACKLIAFKPIDMLMNVREAGRKMSVHSYIHIYQFTSPDTLSAWNEVQWDCDPLLAVCFSAVVLTTCLVILAAVSLPGRAPLILPAVTSRREGNRSCDIFQ